MMQAQHSDDRELVDIAYRRLIEAHANGAIDDDEFFYNLIIAMVHREDSDSSGWERCLQMLPRFDVRSLHQYARDMLEECNFMPDPGPFVSNTSNQEAKQEAMRRMQPAYRNLYNVIRIASGESC